MKLVSSSKENKKMKISAAYAVLMVQILSVICSEYTACEKEKRIHMMEQRDRIPQDFMHDFLHCSVEDKVLPCFLALLMGNTWVLGGPMTKKKWQYILQ